MRIHFQNIYYVIFYLSINGYNRSNFCEEYNIYGKQFKDILYEFTGI